MARRCSDCNKFASLEQADPEVGNLEIDEEGNVTADVRIINQCADCSTELSEATVDMSGHVELTDHTCSTTAINTERLRRARLYENGMAHYRERLSKIGEYVRPTTQEEREYDPDIAYIEHRGSSSVTYHEKSMRDLQKIAGVPSDVFVSDYDVCGNCEFGTIPGFPNKNYIHTNDISKIAALREKPCDPHGVEWCTTCYKPLGPQPPAQPEDPADEEPEFEVEETNAESTDKVEGKGRFGKHFYGAVIDFAVKCSRCGESVATGQLEDYVQASHMEDVG